jgi:hypothetical protein
MSPLQMKRWLTDAYNMLLNSGIYSSDEAKCIVEWFEHMRGSDEYGLMGEDFMDTYGSLYDKLPPNNLELHQWLYGNMTARLWMYAPVLKENFKLQRNSTKPHTKSMMTSEN